MKSMLTNLGYLVLTAKDAWVGINALTAEVPVDLNLSDVVLPGGLSGATISPRVQGAFGGM